MQQGVVATDYKDEIFFQTWKLSKKHKKMIMDKKAEKTTRTKKPGRRLQRISRERKRLFSSNQLAREQILAKKCGTSSGDKKLVTR